MQFQLEHTQWLAGDELRRLQRIQLMRLLRHAVECVPYYTALLGPRFSQKGAGLIDDWEQLPILMKANIQLSADELVSNPLPEEHGPVGTNFTSGSTGTPVSTRSTTVNRLLGNALILRQHVWYRHDLRGKLCAIRFLRDNPLSDNLGVLDNWGAATFGVVNTGAAAVLDIRRPVEEQAEWLEAHDPDYLLTYPSNVLALVERFRDTGRSLESLKEVRTFGELLEPKVRLAVRDQWGVGVTDVYSSQEVGIIALQCPQHEHYHVQSEGMLVEVVDDDNRACHIGETGRVLVTPLHNFAMPLIRYEIGDFAEVGAECPCGRGLPVLTKILGRQRGMALMPNGDRRWPSLEIPKDAGPALPIKQFQLVQKSLWDAELFLVVWSPLSPDQEVMARTWAQMALGFAIGVTIKYVDSIPRGPTGKYEDFRCEIGKVDLPS
jgi:phenylacetate-CoA ligase